MPSSFSGRALLAIGLVAGCSRNAPDLGPEPGVREPAGLEDAAMADPARSLPGSAMPTAVAMDGGRVVEGDAGTGGAADAEAVGARDAGADAGTRFVDWEPPPPLPAVLRALCSDDPGYEDAGIVLPEPDVLRVSDAASLEALRGTTRIDGDLIVASPDGVSAVTLSDLNPLASLTVVCGDLVIAHAPELTSLRGLEQLRYVGGSLRIGDPASAPPANNDALATLDGLSGLEAIGGDLVVVANPALARVETLNALTHVGGSIVIDRHPVLVYLDGLESLVEVGGDLRISQSTSLRRIRGLSALIEVGRHLWLTDLLSLIDLQGLSGLRRVGGDLWIGGTFNYDYDGSRELTNLGAFGGLQEIGGTLRIEGTRAVHELTALSGLTPGAGIRIVGNYALETLDAFAHLTDYSGGIEIRSNRAIEDMRSFRSLRSVGSLHTSVPSTAGLEGLEVVYGDLAVTGKNCVPLSSLRFVGGNARIPSYTPGTCFDALAGVGGMLELVGGQAASETFPALAQVGTLRIADTSATEIRGFQRLRRAGTLRIESNEVLTTVTGFPALIELDRLEVGCTFDGSPDRYNFSLARVELPAAGPYDACIGNSPQLSELVAPPELVALGTLRIQNSPALTSLEGLASVWSLGALDIRQATALDPCSVGELASRLSLTCDDCDSAVPCSCLTQAGDVHCQ